MQVDTRVYRAAAADRLHLLLPFLIWHMAETTKPDFAKLEKWSDDILPRRVKCCGSRLAN